MEFLRTPEPAAAQLAAAAATPRTPLTANGAANGALDRAGIKSSFQQLFTPNHANLAPGFLPTASGLTPFLGGATPNFVTPGIGMMPMGSPPQGKHSAEIMLSSPYLQAAAKEAVRREFMNMPSYITGTPQVPAPAGSPPQKQVYSTDGRPVAGTPPAKAAESTQSEAADENNRVVPTDDNKNASTADDTDSEGAAKVPASAPNASKAIPTNVPPPAAAAMPYAGHQPPFFAPPGVFLMPQMVPGHHPAQMNTMNQMNGGVFVHPGNGMMMYAGMPGVGIPGMHANMMMMPHMANVNTGMAVGTKPIPKHETTEQRKARVEEEKQELIREFKKKTREAALVRFRQKRRERRFGKLIRYACRKQLADARPRVKGRFVRIKEDEAGTTKKETESTSPASAANKKTSRKNKKTAEDAPQVVPNIK